MQPLLALLQLLLQRQQLDSSVDNVGSRQPTPPVKKYISALADHFRGWYLLYKLIIKVQPGIITAVVGAASASSSVGAGACGSVIQ
jgi:hypothetical protein